MRLIFVLGVNERMSHPRSCFSGGTVEDLRSCLMILSCIKTGKPPLPSHSVPVFLSVCAGTLQPVSPWRWLFSILVPFVLTVRAFNKRSLDRSGALGGECQPAEPTRSPHPHRVPPHPANAGRHHSDRHRAAFSFAPRREIIQTVPLVCVCVWDC